MTVDNTDLTYAHIFEGERKTIQRINLKDYSIVGHLALEDCR